MKKSIKYLVAFATLFATPLTMTACGGTPAEVVEKLETVLDNIENIPTTATADFKLPVTGIGGAAITWTSSNTAVIAIDGVNAKVTRPSDGDVTVTLTATATVDGYSDSKTFAVTVTAIELSAYDIISVAEAKNAAEGAEVTVRGVVSRPYPYQDKNSGALKHSGTYVTDETGTIHVYGSKFAEQVAPGTEVVLSAIKTHHYGAIQLKTPNLELEIGKDREMPLNSVIEGVSIDEILAVNDDVENIANNVYKLEGQIGINAGTDSKTGNPYKSYYFQDDANKRLSIYMNGSAGDIPLFAWMDEYVGIDLTVAFVINSSNKDGKWRGHIIHIYE